MCGGGAPPPPDYSAMAAASEYAADRAFDISQNQTDWSRQQWGEQKAMLDRVLDQQMGIADEQHANAQADRQRYNDVFQPIEDDLVEDFRSYDSPERRELQAGRASAAVTSAADIQRKQAQRRLESYGIDPGQTRSAALDVQARMATAANAAAAGNNERNRVENTGRALRAEAINIGKGLPSQVAQSYGQTLNAGNSAMGNMNSTMQSQSNMYNQALGGIQAGTAAVGQQANIANMGYQNQMAAFDANNQLGPMGQLAGMGIGAMGAAGMEAGGEVPGDMSAIPSRADRHPAMLADNEYVIPAEVVKWKGLEFFDKLTAKSRADQGLPEVPAGEQAIPQQTPPGGMNAGGYVPQDIPAMAPPEAISGYNPDGALDIENEAARLQQTGAALYSQMKAKRDAQAGNALEAGITLQEGYAAGKDRRAKKAAEKAEKAEKADDAKALKGNVVKTK